MKYLHTTETRPGVTNKSKAILLLVSGILFGTLLSWMIIVKPWETEVWVTTRIDAFTSPTSTSPPATAPSGRTPMYVGITPAKWPEEATQIWNAARRGKLVHVTLEVGGEAAQFEIRGVTENGDMVVLANSPQHAKYISELLGISVHAK